MKLDSIQFTEYEGQDREWILEDTALDTITLVVGKNASGKSRFLSIIASLGKLLSGNASQLFESGKYLARFSNGETKFEYILHYENKVVVGEKLSKDGDTLLDRGKDGAGTIWAEKLGAKIDFQSPVDQLAAKVRQDAIQHPYLAELHNWASLLRHYQFGTPLGRDHFLLLTQTPATTGESSVSEIVDPNEVTKLYIRAFAQYEEPFDQAVLRDMKSLGYDCTDIGAEGADIRVIQGPPMAWLFLQEKGLKAKTSQVVMSQGMFRALSIVIHLNYCIFRKIARTILIDDIGEGLDFSRAQSFISLLISKSIQNNLQLLMTTNDRFVMNGVPLKHWGVLSRKENKVRITNIKTAPKIFEEFEELGLSNFDFFSTNFFEEGAK